MNEQQHFMSTMRYYTKSYFQIEQETRSRTEGGPDRAKHGVGRDHDSRVGSDDRRICDRRNEKRREETRREEKRIEETRREEKRRAESDIAITSTSSPSTKLSLVVSKQSRVIMFTACVEPEAPFWPRDKYDDPIIKKLNYHIENKRKN